MILSCRENITLKDTHTYHHNTPFAQTPGSREWGGGKGVRKVKNRIKEKAGARTQAEISENVLQTEE